jgi:hypothetical protein
VNCRGGCWQSFQILKPDSSKRGEFVFKDGQWMAAVTPDTVVDLSIFDRGPSDPTHYGHPFWIFCHWMEVLQSPTLEEQSADDE